MVAAIRARDEIFRRLQAVADSFSELYPDIQPPKCYLGFPANEPPFYIVVDDIIDTGRTSGAVTMGHARLEFGIHVWVFANHANQTTAADTLINYIDAVFNAILIDQTLAGAVDNSFPQVDSAGTAADGSKRYMAAAALTVECQTFSTCPDGLGQILEV